MSKVPAAALPWFWLSVTIATACRDVPQCESGTDGCLNGRCRENGACALDLVCDIESDRCVRARGDDEEGRADGPPDHDGADAPPPEAGSDGDAGAPDECAAPNDGICDEAFAGGRCASGSDQDDCGRSVAEPYCVLPVQPVVAETSLPGCEATSFEDACREACLTYCAKRYRYCGKPCPEDMCAPSAEMLEVCRQNCPDRDASCLNGACSNMLSAACEGWLCAEDTPADCTARCDDSCGATDGVCQDGELRLDATDTTCARGTDCTDCGPRYASPVPVGRSQECLSALDCGLAAGQRVRCVRIVARSEGESPTIARCMDDCSEPGDTCPPYTECTPLQGGGAACAPAWSCRPGGGVE